MRSVGKVRRSEHALQDLVLRAQLREEGKSWSDIGAELGMRGESVRRLCDDAGAGFARVEVMNEMVARGLVLVTPSGFRVEGLDAAGAAMLIRRLS
jgi:hypothetical protein